VRDGKNPVGCGSENKRATSLAGGAFVFVLDFMIAFTRFPDTGRFPNR
jgi:hypothetical protein